MKPYDDRSARTRAVPFWPVLALLLATILLPGRQVRADGIYFDNAQPWAFGFELGDYKFKGFDDARTEKSSAGALSVYLELYPIDAFGVGFRNIAILSDETHVQTSMITLQLVPFAQDFWLRPVLIAGYGPARYSIEIYDPDGFYVRTVDYGGAARLFGVFLNIGNPWVYLRTGIYTLDTSFVTPEGANLDASGQFTQSGIGFTTVIALFLMG